MSFSFLQAIIGILTDFYIFVGKKKHNKDNYEYNESKCRNTP